MTVEELAEILMNMPLDAKITVSTDAVILYDSVTNYLDINEVYLDGEKVVLEIKVK